MTQAKFNFTKSIIYVSFLALIALSLSSWIGQNLLKADILDTRSALLLQGFLMSGVILPGIWLIRRYVDKNHTMDMGISKRPSPILLFLLGSGMVIVPIIITLTISHLIGWTSITINIGTEAIMPVLIGLITVLLFEAIPEELVFRGYIYGALRSNKGKWLSATISVFLFVMLPVFTVQIQKYLLGMDISIGGSASITGGYLIVMMLFGSFMMYLRIISGSIWMTIGFHSMFVFIDRLIGLSNSSLIQIPEETNQTAVQITLMSCYLVMALLLITWIIMSNRKNNQSIKLVNH